VTLQRFPAGGGENGGSLPRLDSEKREATAEPGRNRPLSSTLA